MSTNPKSLALNKDWHEDCLKWRGEILVGEFAHWCFEFDGLPVDETCGEWAYCTCFIAEKPDAH